jgi:putative transposase
MPWKVKSLIEVRQRLVESALARRQPLKVLCWGFGICRTTAYKWIARFRHGGRNGLRDRSRRPQHSPTQLSPKWIKAIGRVRRRRPHWGAKKIHYRLRKEHPRARLPCVRTIQRWLRRLGRVRPPPRRARRGPPVPHPGLTVPSRPNQVWTVDFKGWFRTADGQRQEPLTIRDLFSRYVLRLHLLPNQQDRLVRGSMRGVFRQHGLPEAIRVDNGAPFGGKGALGLSRLSVWWLRLGIRVEFTRRARPGDNAAHEHFHGCYQREVVEAGAGHRRAMQRQSNRWVADYNRQRPHEALGQQPPARWYRPSRRSYPQALLPLRYPKAWLQRRVRNRGHIKWQGCLRFVGRAFVGQTVGLHPLEEHLWAVYLGKLLIGHLHDHDAGGMRPARWRREPTPLKV